MTPHDAGLFGGYGLLPRRTLSPPHASNPAATRARAAAGYRRPMPRTLHLHCWRPYSARRRSAKLKKRYAFKKNPPNNLQISKNALPLHRNSEEHGVVVQLVRIPACHAGGRGFESRPYRKSCKIPESNDSGIFLFEIVYFGLAAKLRLRKAAASRSLAPRRLAKFTPQAPSRNCMPKVVDSPSVKASSASGRGITAHSRSGKTILQAIRTALPRCGKRTGTRLPAAQAALPHRLHCRQIVIWEKFRTGSADRESR